MHLARVYILQQRNEIDWQTWAIMCFLKRQVASPRMAWGFICAARGGGKLLRPNTPELLPGTKGQQSSAPVASKGSMAAGSQTSSLQASGAGPFKGKGLLGSKGHGKLIAPMPSAVDSSKQLGPSPLQPAPNTMGSGASFFPAADGASTFSKGLLPPSMGVNGGLGPALGPIKGGFPNSSAAMMGSNVVCPHFEYSRPAETPGVMMIVPVPLNNKSLTIKACMCLWDS